MNFITPAMLPSPVPLAILPNVPLDFIRAAAWLPPTTVRIPARAATIVTRLIVSLVTDANVRIERRVALDDAPIRAALRFVLAADRRLGAEDIKARASLALAGDWRGLAERTLSVARSPAPPKRDNLAKAQRLAEAGNISRAIQALAPIGTAAPFALSDVSALYPPAVGTQNAHNTPSSAALATGPSYLRGRSTPNDTWDDKVWAAVRAVRPESQPGPSGLRAEHLKLAAAKGGAIVAAFATLIDHAVAGRVTGPFLTDSVLGMLPKTPGKFRPIGIGDIVRRIAGRLVARDLAARLRPALEAQAQLALSPAGTTLAHLRVRDAADQRRYILQMDIRNAFNAVHRHAVMTAIPADDHAFPLVHALYSEPNALNIPALEHRFVQSRGVVQGCPLAGHLFAAAIANATSRVASVHRDVDVVWFADDGHASSASSDALDAYRDDLAVALLGLGLELAPSKCHLMPPHALRDHVVPPRLAAACTRVDMIRTLGGPIVSSGHPDRDAILDDEWRKLATGIERKVSRLASFKDPQHTTLALAMAGSWSRLEHAATLAALDRRRVPCHVIQSMESADRCALAQALGEYAGALDDAGWRRATLPFRSGGLGIHDVSVELDAAVARADAIRRHAEPAHSPIAPGVDIERMRAAAYNSAVEGVLAALPQGTPRGEAFRDIVAAAPHLWLSQPATSGHGTLLSRDVAPPAIALFLGLQVLPAATQCFCRGASAVDVHASHVAGCFNSLSARHNNVRDILAAAARRAVGTGNVWTEVDVDTLGRPCKPDNNGRRPGDLAFRSPTTDRWAFIDVIVQSPTQAFLDARRRAAPGAPTSLAAFGDSQKEHRHRDDVARFARAPCSYSFFSMGAFGSLSRPAARSLDSIVHMLRASGATFTTDPSIFVRWKIHAAVWSKLGANVHDLRRRSAADLIQRRRLPSAPSAVSLVAQHRGAAAPQRPLPGSRPRHAVRVAAPGAVPPQIAHPHSSARARVQSQNNLESTAQPVDRNVHPALPSSRAGRGNAKRVRSDEESPPKQPNTSRIRAAAAQQPDYDAIMAVLAATIDPTTCGDRPSLGEPHDTSHPRQAANSHAPPPTPSPSETALDQRVATHTQDNAAGTNSYAANTCSSRRVVDVDHDSEADGSVTRGAP